MSSFQVHISDHDIVTPGDSPNVLVAMNPRRSRRTCTSCRRVRRSSRTGARSTSATSPRSATTPSPLEDESLAEYRLVRVPMTELTLEACRGSA
ncbi:MAG: hypothetical protein U0W40_20185 [Acidimicrobiia bacterium]